jgi:hypothetical protein
VLFRPALLLFSKRRSYGGKGGLIFCFTKPPVKRGFVRHNIDNKTKTAILSIKTPSAGRFCAREYYELQSSHIIATGEPGRARPCRTKTARGQPTGDHRERIYLHSYPLSSLDGLPFPPAPPGVTSIINRVAWRPRKCLPRPP